MAFEAENIRDWLGKKVVDPAGSKIGDMEAVYYDTATDEPSFATVELGMFTRKRLAFVPLSGAMVHPDHVKITVSRDVAKDAPSIDTDGELPVEDEPAIFAHYGIDYGPRTGRRLARR